MKTETRNVEKPEFSFRLSMCHVFYSFFSPEKVSAYDVIIKKDEVTPSPTRLYYDLLCQKLLRKNRAAS